MKAKLLSYGIPALIGAAIALAIMGAKGVFTETDTVQVMQILSDSFFVPGVILAGVGALVFASNGGLFDIFGFGFHMFINLFRRDVTKRKYRTFYDYRQEKKEKKRPIAFLLIVGAIFIVVSICFLIPYYALQQPGM